MEAAAPDAVRVRELEPADFSRWDEFVSACPEATFFHRAGWKTVIERAFGHRAKFLYAESDGRIEAVLPLAEVKSILFGHFLVSLPFCVYGGIAAGCERARRALDEAAGGDDSGVAGDGLRGKGPWRYSLGRGCSRASF